MFSSVLAALGFNRYKSRRIGMHFADRFFLKNFHKMPNHSVIRHVTDQIGGIKRPLD